MFRSVGRDASDAAVMRWIKERDISQDGTVTFEEFIGSYRTCAPPTRVIKYFHDHIEQKANGSKVNGDVVMVEDDHLVLDPRTGTLRLSANYTMKELLRSRAAIREAKARENLNLLEQVNRKYQLQRTTKRQRVSAHKRLQCMHLEPWPLGWVCSSCSTASQLYNVHEAVIDRVSRVIASPSDRRLWVVDTTLDKDFDSKIGRFRGGLQLMASFGWIDEAAAEEEAINATMHAPNGKISTAAMGVPLTDAAAQQTTEIAMMRMPGKLV